MRHITISQAQALLQTLKQEADALGLTGDARTLFFILRLLPVFEIAPLESNT